MQLNSNQRDINTLFICAFRYSLGRMTYMPSEVCRIIEDNLGLLDKHTAKIIIEEITTAHNRNQLGMDIDQQNWLDFRRKIKTVFFTQDDTLTDDEKNILSYFSVDWCFNYRFLEHETGKTRKELAPIIKKLKKLSFISYHRALFTDDGETAGSGWSLTNEGWKYQEGQLL